MNNFYSIKRTLFFLGIYVTALALSSLSATAAENKPAPKAAVTGETPEALFKTSFPSIQYESFEKSAIEGLYEVDTDKDIFYFNPTNRFLVVGEIFTTTGKSLTAEKRTKILSVHYAKMLKEIPLEKAIKIGNGKNIVIEFTDPDCPYCRRGYSFIKTKTDMTHYVFFAPLAHPNAITKVAYVLGSENKENAYNDVMSGKLDKIELKDITEKGKVLAQEHLEIAKKIGIEGTPTFFINGQIIVGADTNMIESLLSSSKKQK